MRTWDFTLILDRDLTDAETEAWDEHGEDLGDEANGSLTPEYGGGRAEVVCHTPGESLIDAIMRASYAVMDATGARVAKVVADPRTWVSAPPQEVVPPTLLSA
ncbi:hypothetical protein AB0I72_00765 [Nocardiopsis sp. NPDC049922]|uniref:hypothetical protein n=1 Tax=Nocardiopsis sp. NPDC049922 TaxID=3155157 RepID=UPI0033FD7B38